MNTQNDYHVSIIWLRFIRVCKYDKEFLCAYAIPNWLGFLDTSLSDMWKSHSTIQSGAIGWCVIKFNDIPLSGSSLGGKRESGKKKTINFLK